MPTEGLHYLLLPTPNPCREQIITAAHTCSILGGKLNSVRYLLGLILTNIITTIMIWILRTLFYCELYSNLSNVTLYGILFKFRKWTLFEFVQNILLQTLFEFDIHFWVVEYYFITNIIWSWRILFNELIVCTRYLCLFNETFLGTNFAEVVIFWLFMKLNKLNIYFSNGNS